MTGSTPAPPWLPFAIIGGFVIFFPLIWCCVVWLLSQIGGWSRLAKHYAARGAPVYGREFRSVTGMVGGTSYRGVLTVHVNEEGFFLEPMTLFRIAHPRLFIPWREVAERTSLSVLWWKAERLTIGAPKIGTITLPENVLAQRTK